MPDSLAERWDVTHWQMSHRFDKAALPMADRHYNRQKPGTPQFVPPGRCIVLIADGALWVSSWPYAEFTKHEWSGAWINSCFRRETNPTLASVLIREAVAITRHIWGEPPSLGMVTFIDATKIRHKRDPGRCYLKAGFKRCGETKVNRLLAFQLTPDQMPDAVEPLGFAGQMSLMVGRKESPDAR
jgi:hypothetical protein